MIRMAFLVAFISSLIGCDPKPPETKPNTNFVVGDIRGDTLGMSSKDYVKKRPFCHGYAEHCVENDSYGGMNALKTTLIFQDRLFFVEYQITLSGDEQELLADLKQKYGEPRRLSNYSWKWSNGKETVEYEKAEGYMTVRFSIDEVFSQWSADYSRKKATKRKSDM